MNRAFSYILLFPVCEIEIHFKSADTFKKDLLIHLFFTFIILNVKELTCKNHNHQEGNL